MNESYFNIVVKKLRKRKDKIIDVQKIKNIVHSILDENYNDKKAYKMIYLLKNKWYLVSIKKNILLVKLPTDSFSENDIIDLYYRDSVKSHCKESCATSRYIWWLKSLELNINNYSISEDIDIYNKEKNATEIALLTKKIIFKTYSQKKKNLRTTFAKHTHKIVFNGHILPIAKLELSLLESLHNPSILQKWYIKELIKQVLRKYKNKLDLTIFTSILQTGKHHASINRLYQLIKGIDEEAAKNIETIIKKYSFVLQKGM